MSGSPTVPDAPGVKVAHAGMVPYMTPSASPTSAPSRRSIGDGLLGLSSVSTRWMSVSWAPLRRTKPTVRSSDLILRRSGAQGPHQRGSASTRSTQPGSLATSLRYFAARFIAGSVAQPVEP